MGSLNMVIATTSLDTRSPFKEAIQNAKSSGKLSTKLATKKSRSKNVKLSMSKKLMKIPKLNVLLDMKRNAKTRNGNQPTRDARASMLTIVKMFPSPDTRMSLNKNAKPSTSKSPLKSPERLPSGNALENHPMNTLPLKSENTTSLATRFI